MKRLLLFVLICGCEDSHTRYKRYLIENNIPFEEYTSPKVIFDQETLKESNETGVPLELVRKRRGGRVFGY